MKKFVPYFLIGFCVMFGLLSIHPEPARGDEEALWREIRILREEVAELREDLQLVLSFIGQWAIDEEASDSAEANNIINDLRNMKSATLVFYVENMDIIHDLPQNVNLVEHLWQFLDTPGRFVSELYILKIFNNNEWWVGYDLDKAEKSDAVREILHERAASMGLHGDTRLDTAYTNQGMVWMKAR